MKITKEKLLFLGILLALGLFALTAHHWLPSLLKIISPNAQFIQSLASLLQIAIWIGFFVAFLSGLFFGDKNNFSKDRTNQEDQTKSKIDKHSLSDDVIQTNTYSVNADTIHSLNQGNNNKTTINFNKSSTQRKEQ